MKKLTILAAIFAIGIGVYVYAATTVTGGPVLSNINSPSSTSDGNWLTIWTFTRPVQSATVQFINDASLTGAARVSIGDDNNPLYVPAGGSLSVDDLLIVGPIKIKRDSSTNIASLKIQLVSKGGSAFETQ